jgi:putative ABC transport system ATP-binding protein
MMGTSTLTPAVELDGLRPRRTSSSWHEPVSLRVESGSFVTVVTTPLLAASLFRLALGLDTPYNGTIRVLGLEPHTLRRAELRRFRRRVGSALLPDGLMANITLRDNVMLPLVFGDGVSNTEARSRAEEVLAQFGLDEWAGHRPSDLSPDTRQIAGLARAVAARPDVLLLHDPLTSVPNLEAQRLLRICRQYAPTILAAVHGEEEAVCVMADAAMTWDAQGYRELARR